MVEMTHGAAAARKERGAEAVIRLGKKKLVDGWGERKKGLNVGVGVGLNMREGSESDSHNQCIDWVFQEWYLDSLNTGSVGYSDILGSREKCHSIQLSL